MTIQPGTISAQLQPRGVAQGGPARTPYTTTDQEHDFTASRAVASLGERIVGAVDYFRSGGRDTLETNLDHEGLPTLLRRHHSVVRLRIMQLGGSPEGVYTMDVSAVTVEMQERLEARIIRACFERGIVVTGVDHRLGSTTLTFRSDAAQPPRVPEGFTVAAGY